MTEAAQRRAVPHGGAGRGSILLVEDDRVDAMAVQRAFRELKIGDRLEVVLDGVGALEHLEARGEELPDLILLDLNMPRMNGVEFLFARRERERLRDIPVVVMTTSTDERDKRLRTAALLRYGDKRIAIDCGPDFRQQMLRSQTRRLDAILRKVSEEGMGALTSRERKYLERAGRRSEGGSG